MTRFISLFECRALAKRRSDHVPLEITIQKQLLINRGKRNRKKSFNKFKKEWLRDDECGNIISDAWNLDPSCNVKQKIAACSLSLRSWSSKKSIDFKDEIGSRRELMGNLMKLPLIEDNIAEMRRIDLEIDELEDGGNDMQPVLDAVETRVTDEMNALLTEAFTREEVICALKHMHPTKALDPDGMPTLFYKKFWDVVGDDVVSYVLDILNNNAPIDPINHTHIVLIPKNNECDSTKDYQPISLCNVLYKLVSKVLSNKLKLILPSVISENQSAFVPGRLIMDNVLVEYEIFHYLCKKKSGIRGYMAMKLDMSKAYDRMEWGFIEGMMLNLGFNHNFVSLIMRCLSSVSYSILVNGFLTSSFVPSRGLRQGDLISPFLFLICAEGFSALLRNAEQSRMVHGVKLVRNVDPISLEMLQLKLNFTKVEGHEKYLGLPTYIGRSKKVVFQVIQDRVWKQWGQKDGERKLVLIRWDKMCKSKKKGGLDLRDMRAFNSSLLAKQCWRIVKNPFSLAARVLKGKYFPRTSFWEANVPPSASYTWRTIMSARELLKEGSNRVVGNGKSIKIWGNYWVPSLPGSKLFSPPSSKNDSRLLVLEWIDVNEEGHKFWNMGQWKGTKNGEFTVRSAYHFELQRSKSNAGPSNIVPDVKLWRKIWEASVPPKVKSVTWRAVRGGLPLSPLRIDTSIGVNFSAKEWSTEMMQKLTMNKGWEIFMMFWRKIWDLRNLWTFEHKKVEAPIACERMLSFLGEFEAATLRETTAPSTANSGSEHTWIPPPHGVYMLNTDAALSKKGRIGLGMVVRLTILVM
ncbi:uncharacterized protein LOC110719774 [Chenopodium quinoa]|uniref:uncharacterized protein LOC110719774 n=1 Tax=Chenopodium quinoa TaxID=63459 RepID=UPI000B77FDF5|nr:uncharacterized protein LOC110719774 [Chenopodium quinoa]